MSRLRNLALRGLTAVRGAFRIDDEPVERVREGFALGGMSFSHVGQCLNCARYVCGEVPTCEAFPAGIPLILWDDVIQHGEPYPGDNGVTFLAKNPLGMDGKAH